MPVTTNTMLLMNHTLNTGHKHKHEYEHTGIAWI